ncbi:MAG TPA: hypothetical protein PLK30_15595 [Blastocatellia bacterium]|nr:hypothetical protein [Blastocatellia bacterium]
MGVKFEIADWKFEITLKELVCQPIPNKIKDGRRGIAGGKRNKNIRTRNKEIKHELDYATRRQVG